MRILVAGVRQHIGCGRGVEVERGLSFRHWPLASLTCSLSRLPQARHWRLPAESDNLLILTEWEQRRLYGGSSLRRRGVYRCQPRAARILVFLLFDPRQVRRGGRLHNAGHLLRPVQPAHASHAPQGVVTRFSSAISATQGILRTSGHGVPIGVDWYCSLGKHVTQSERWRFRLPGSSGRLLALHRRLSRRLSSSCSLSRNHARVEL